MNPIFKLSSAIVALALVLGFVAAPLSAAPTSTAGAPVEIKVQDGTVRRRVAAGMPSSDARIHAVVRVLLHANYVEVHTYTGRVVVISREDFIDLAGMPKA